MRQDRIDVHHHVLPRFFREAQTAGGYPSTAYRPFPDWSPETSLALMDRQGIATAILSFSAPGLYYGDRPACRELARRCNDYLAGLIAGHAGRFGAFAALPFPDVDDCLAEIEYAEHIGLDGFMPPDAERRPPGGPSRLPRDLPRARPALRRGADPPDLPRRRAPSAVTSCPGRSSTTPARPRGRRRACCSTGCWRRCQESDSSCRMPAARCRRSPTASRSSTRSRASARTTRKARAPISGGSTTTPRSRAMRRCSPRCKASPDPTAFCSAPTIPIFRTRSRIRRPPGPTPTRGSTRRARAMMEHGNAKRLFSRLAEGA